MYIRRFFEQQIAEDLTKRKVVILFGPRRVGKTTLVQRFRDEYTGYYNCDLTETRTALSQHNLEHLRVLIAPYRRLIIDEAQLVPGIGRTLKILIDAFPEKQFLVTGSSALDLSRSVSEPLTGRFLSHTLLPVGEGELAVAFDPIQLAEGRELRLRFGSYPEIITTQSIVDKERFVKNIAETYLFKDILALGDLRRPELLEKIARAVSLQVGSELSLTELGVTVDSDKNTVSRYLELLEKTFVLFSLSPFRTNKRRSISQHKKYYFYDLGIRNALIGSTNPMDMRNDKGGIWENYCIVERMKYNQAKSPLLPNYYFWRAYDGQELDLIEERDGVLAGFECKYTSGAIGKPLREFFIGELGGSSLEVISRDTASKWLQ
ncbi:MAG: ATP-binding protein [bacterium]|nr:ATP-binding protein [bacterium]